MASMIVGLRGYLMLVRKILLTGGKKQNWLKTKNAL
jgi:hypothetical protein